MKKNNYLFSDYLLLLVLFNNLKYGQSTALRDQIYKMQVVQYYLR